MLAFFARMFIIFVLLFFAGNIFSELCLIFSDGVDKKAVCEHLTNNTFLLLFCTIMYGVIERCIIKMSTAGKYW